jgi:hypothetical protein
MRSTAASVCRARSATALRDGARRGGVPWAARGMSGILEGSKPSPDLRLRPDAV